MKTVLSTLTGLALATTLFASESSSPGGSYFAVIVDDVDISSAWYQSILGVREISRVSQDGRYDIVNLAKAGLFIELLELSSAAKRPEGYVQGPFKLGFLVEDVEAFVGSLPEGVTLPEIIHDERNGLLMVQLRDPDGYILQVMEIL